MTLVLDWQNASRPDEPLTEVVDALRRGGLVALPSEAGYVYAFAGSSPDALNLLRKTQAEPFYLTWPIAELGERFSNLSLLRLLRRCWPGPLTVSIAAQVAWSDGLPHDCPAVTDGRARLWMPRHSALQHLCRRVDFPWFVVEPAAPLGSPDAVLEKAGDDLALLLDAGPVAALGSTQVVLNDHMGFTMTRAGALDEAELMKAQACWIVMVCTGNTCRSPMAEAIFKAALAARLGCPVDQLIQRGYWVASAGVAAMDGDDAAPEAVEIAKQCGVDLGAHRSRLLAVDLAAEADHLIAMTRNHLLTIASRYPMLGGTLRLLCGREGDLDDPLGGGPDVYRECADRIRRHVERIVAEMRLA